MESSARFCGECGSANKRNRSASPEARNFAQSFAAHRVAGPMHIGHDHNNGVKTQALPPKTPQRTPKFAKVHSEVPQELKEELSKLIVLLARERVFLYMHCIIFLIVNAIGFVLAMNAYNGYIGDEMTKTIIAMTPLMFINSFGLVCLVPIKGTKREIARLKEKLSYVKFQIEYRNVF